MAAGTWTFFGRAKVSLGTGGFNFSGNTFIVTLHASGTPFSAGHDITTLASASALNAQLASSNNYDKGGQTMSGPAGWVLSTNDGVFSRAGACWSANGGTLGGANIRWALLRTAASANADGQPLAFAALSSTGFAVADGNTLKLHGGRSATAKIFTLA